MVTFSGTISTKDGVVKDKKGGKGTIATKKTRDKNILTKDKKKELNIQNLMLLEKSMK